ERSAGLVPNTTAGITDHKTVGNGQAGNRNSRPALDVEDAAGVVAADGQLAGARPLDVHTLIDGELAGQRDGFAVEAGGEADLSAALSGGDLGPQRAGAVVQAVQHGQRAGQPAVFEGFKAQTGGGPFANMLVRVSAHTGTGAFPVPQAGREPHDASPMK